MRRVLHDITRPVRVGTPVWPGDTPYRIEWTLRRREGAAVNLCELHLSTHTGTHVDAPFHASDEGDRVGELPLESFVGDALLIAADGCGTIGPELLERALRGESAGRVLVRTGCWADPDRFPERIAPLDPRCVEMMARSGVRLFGTDAPSVDPFDSQDLPAHQALRHAGIVHLESLLLDGIAPGRYHLIALPLRLTEADASPVRAVLCPPER